jgi:hypothetical protein
MDQVEVEIVEEAAKRATAIEEIAKEAEAALKDCWEPVF